MHINMCASYLYMERRNKKIELSILKEKYPFYKSKIIA